jgi:hypothetical protein
MGMTNTPTALAYCCENGRRLLKGIYIEQGVLQSTARKASGKKYVSAKMLADIDNQKEVIAVKRYTFEQHVKGCAPTSR